MRTIKFALEPSFETSANADPIWVVRLSVGMDFALDMLSYPTARRSVVTRPIFHQALGFLGENARQGSGLLLRDPRIAGQAVPDIVVYPSIAPGRLRVDGFLGLNFFEQFDVVEWRPKTRLVRLTVE